MEQIPVTICQVLHPGTNKVLALEIVANDGEIYFVTADSCYFEGLRCGSFPNDGHGQQIERVEIARLE